MFTRLRIWLLALANPIRSTWRSLRTAGTVLTGFSSHIPNRIAIAPQDLHTTDPSLASEYYHGQYVFDGIEVATEGRKPFDIPEAPEHWRRKLHEFEWLRHLSASSEPLAASHARAMVQDWLNLHNKGADRLAWEVDVAARRLMAWQRNSIAILTNAEPDFYRQFMRSLGAHVRYLKRHTSSAPAGMPRLLGWMAVALASVCHAGHRASLDGFRDRLDQELVRQVLVDGGHVSRNPDVVLELLSLLLPYRQTLIAAGVSPSADLSGAIDRMLPALRLFRLGDGDFVRFNGASVTRHDLLATVLRYDQALGQPPNDAAGSGYQRVDSGGLILVMDTGAPPSGEMSTEAHAGCLAFEFSAGEEAIVVNCGAPPIPVQAEKAVWRSTAAHSTAVMNETSSARFQEGGTVGRLLGGQLLAPELDPKSERGDDSNGTWVEASHKAYFRQFGFRHVRRLLVSADGSRVDGKDRFTNLNNEPVRYSPRDDVVMRFHLHPDLSARIQDGQALLVTRSGAEWKFECNECPVEISDSIFFATHSGARQTQQLVLGFGATKTSEVNWSFRRI